MQQNGILPSFYEQEALTLAPMLLGKLIYTPEVTIRILETEAYMPNDSACHAFKGKTKRNSPMFLKGGIWYVYLCYGIHHLLNVVAGSKASPQAVLIRAAEVVEGCEKVQERRRNQDLIGPGKVGQALALDTGFSGEVIGARIAILDAPIVKYTRHKRVGIGYAAEKDQNALWRFMTEPIMSV